MSDNNCFLLGLAPELLKQITAELDDLSVLAFRQVSRKICEAADDAFTSIFFAERKHLLHSDSLRTLVAVTEDEALSRSIERITLYAAAATYAYQNDDFFDEMIQQRHSISNSRFQAQQNKITNLKAAIETEIPGLLVTIFTNLVAANANPTIKFASHDCCQDLRHCQQHKSYVHRKLGEMLPFLLQGATYRFLTSTTPLPERDFALSAILNAIASAKFKVSGFGLDMAIERNGRGSGNLKLINLPGLKASFSSLKFLELDLFGCPKLPNRWFAVLNELVQTAAPFMQAVKLVVPNQSDGGHLPRDLQWIVDLLASSNLRSLDISNIWYPQRWPAYERILVALLQNQQQSLKNLKLCARTRVDETVMDVVVHKLRLHQVEIRKSRFGENHLVCQYKGSEDQVRAGLVHTMGRNQPMLWQLTSWQMTQKETDELNIKIARWEENRPADDLAESAAEFWEMAQVEEPRWAMEFFQMVEEQEKGEVMNVAEEVDSEWVSTTVGENHGW